MLSLVLYGLPGSTVGISLLSPLAIETQFYWHMFLAGPIFWVFKMIRTELVFVYWRRKRMVFSLSWWGKGSTGKICLLQTVPFIFDIRRPADWKVIVRSLIWFVKSRGRQVMNLLVRQNPAIGRIVQEKWMWWAIGLFMLFNRRIVRRKSTVKTTRRVFNWILMSL